MAKGVVLKPAEVVTLECSCSYLPPCIAAAAADAVCGGVRVSIHLGLKPNQKLGKLKVTMRT